MTPGPWTQPRHGHTGICTHLAGHGHTRDSHTWHTYGMDSGDTHSRGHKGTRGHAGDSHPGHAPAPPLRCRCRCWSYLRLPPLLSRGRCGLCCRQQPQRQGGPQRRCHPRSAPSAPLSAGRRRPSRLSPPRPRPRGRPQPQLQPRPRPRAGLRQQHRAEGLSLLAPPRPCHPDRGHQQGNDPVHALSLSPGSIALPVRLSFSQLEQWLCPV